MAERSEITELRMRGFGSQVCVVTCVLVKVYRDPGLIFLQYFNQVGIFKQYTFLIGLIIVLFISCCLCA